MPRRPSGCAGVLTLHDLRDFGTFCSRDPRAPRSVEHPERTASRPTASSCRAHRSPRNSRSVSPASPRGSKSYRLPSALADSATTPRDEAAGLLHIGRPEARKRIDFLLHAFARAETRDHELVLIGAGSTAAWSRLRTLARHLGIEERVAGRGRTRRRGAQPRTRSLPRPRVSISTRGIWPSGPRGDRPRQGGSLRPRHGPRVDRERRGPRTRSRTRRVDSRDRTDRGRPNPGRSTRRCGSAPRQRLRSQAHGRAFAQRLAQRGSPTSLKGRGGAKNDRQALLLCGTRAGSRLSLAKREAPSRFGTRRLRPEPRRRTRRTTPARQAPNGRARHRTRVPANSRITSTTSRSKTATCRKNSAHSASNADEAVLP